MLAIRAASCKLGVSKREGNEMTSKLRYEAKPRPEYKQTPGYTHMLVDNKKRVAVRFGTKGDCDLEAFARNDGQSVG